MELTIGILCSLTIFVRTVNAQYRSQVVRDVTGTVHLVNPDPYSVIDELMERSFNVETDIIYRLYTRLNPEEGQIFKPNEALPDNGSNFNPQHPTRIVVHGWAQDGTSEMQNTLRKSYLSIGDFNVINVDWGKGALTINYITAKNRVSSVGQVISKMIDTLVNGTGISRDTITIVGHSLGAHISGVVGKEQNARISTIIGLDPARPLFHAGNKDTLNEKDSQYVEVIFTNAGGLGYNKPLGNANFYPNGGSIQPGCGFDLLGLCAHARASIYFAESLTSDVGFRATGCNSYDDITAEKCVPKQSDEVWMGGEPSNHGRGVEGFFIHVTNAEQPFAKE